MTVYYNEIDPFAAEWIRQLIQQQHIPFGTVDERDIRDVTPSDLRPFRQCHFFAGIAVWAYAGTRAGYDPDRRWWSGSCPCQPFSASGKRNGFDDERHLWPSWCYLIDECRPAEIVGEQVASKDGYAWLDLVQADMEGMGYACGAVVSPSAGYGAPHERHRTYFGARLADTKRAGFESGRERWSESGTIFASSNGVSGSLADTIGRPVSQPIGRTYQRNGNAAAVRLADDTIIGRDERAGLRGGESTGSGRFQPADSGTVRSMADSHSDRFAASPEQTLHDEEHHVEPRGGIGHNGWTGPVNGFWRDADWLKCRDERWRAVEPGTFPLANGAAARVGRLRGYGNAINAEQAVAFLEAFDKA